MNSGTPLKKIRSSESVQTLTLDPGVLEASDLKALIEQRQLAGLAKYQPDSLVNAASVCLEMAQSHPHEVTVLLWNRGIAEQAENLLKQEKPSPFFEASAEALARCILNAGHFLKQKEDGNPWPHRVRELVTKRADARALYWESKLKKFKLNQEEAFLTVQFRQKRFFGKSKPFFFLNRDYSLEKLNGGFTDPGISRPEGPPVKEEEELVCRHWVQAIKDKPKVFLQYLAEKKDFFSVRASLDLLHTTSRCERGQRSVQFVPAQFGRLLARIAHLVPPGERRSYELSYLCKKGDREKSGGHEMRLFIEKKPSVPDQRHETSPMDLKISLYEPCVTGNMKHLRAWPEDLQTRSFEDFASFSFHDVEVLSLALEDPALARALAGQFIPHEVELQLCSFLNALASGNLHEMQAAAQRLSPDDFKGLNQRREQLLRALDYALQDGHVDAIHAFRRLPLLSLFDETTLEAVALGKYRKESCALEDALKRQLVQAVKAHFEVLRSLAHGLSRSILLKALQMEWERTVDGKTLMLPLLNWALFRQQPKLFAAILSLFQEIKTFKEFECLLDADTISSLMCPDGQGLWAVDRSSLDRNNQSKAMEVFARDFLACKPSRSIVSALLAQAGERLRQAIDHGHVYVVADFMHMVDIVQNDPDYKLSGKDARALSHMMVSARKQPIFFFPCLWLERDAYKKLVKDEPSLRRGFDRVQRELKFS